MYKGWVCPICGHGVSPDVKVCPCKDGQDDKADRLIPDYEWVDYPCTVSPPIIYSCLEDKETLPIRCLSRFP